MSELAESNVILFPTNRIANSQNVGIRTLKLPQTIHDVKVNINLLGHVHINEVMESILPMIATHLGAAGLTITQNDLIKDGALFVESFRSMLCKQYNIEHPFQTLANNIFDVEKDGSIRLASKVTVEF